MPFTVIISEKGGAERREVFDKPEISVGRVQGNELVLPKGNVSKKHVRITYRDARFVVTDLKSTNGTYVNGRKISQATIVRDGDKVYIGDFVLRFEGDREPDQASSPAASPGPSHYPLEQDPDEHAPPAPPMQIQGGPTAHNPLPGAPPRPSPFGPKGTAMLGASPVGPTGTAPPPAPVPQLGPVSPSMPAPPPVAASSLPPAVRSPTPPPRRENAAHAAHRLALATLVDRVSEMIDLAPLSQGSPADEALASRIDRAIKEQVISLRNDGEIPPEADHEALVRDAHREILGIGPLGPLLDDEDISELHVAHESIWAVRGGLPIFVEPAFTSDVSTARIVARLAVAAGQPLQAGEVLVERPIAGGAVMTAILPPASSSPGIAIRRRRRAEGAIEDPVRAGVVSRGMWTFLTQCASARLNMLVVAPPSANVSGLLASLLHASGEWERAVTAHLADDPIVPPTLGVSVTLPDVERSEALLRAACRLAGDRLLVGPIAGALVPAVIEAVSEGRQGVIAVARAPSARHAVARLASDILTSRPGLSADAARESIASSFDVAIEVARLRDGRQRVLRVAELGPVEGGTVSIRDLFHFSVERHASGSVEGSFAPTGVLPRFVEDLRRRGIAVDPSLFDRASVRSSS